MVIPINKNYKLPTNLSGYTANADTTFGENMFLFTPVRHEFLMKIDGKKHILQTLEQVKTVIYKSEAEKYSFLGVICYCGFLVDKTFSCDKRLDLNKEVKYLIRTNINCNKTTKNGKVFMFQRIKNWVSTQHLDDSVPFWCDVEEFILKEQESLIESAYVEVELVENQTNLAELKRLESLAEEKPKFNLFSFLRRFI